MSDLDIAQTADELVIRGRRKDVVLWVILACLLVPFSLGIVYQNVVGTADAPAVWTRPGGDQNFIVVALFHVVLAFAAAPVAVCIACVRKRRRPWVFSRPSGRLTRAGQSWPLADLTAVAVDVRRGRLRGGSAGVLLHFGDAATLEVARYHEGKNTHVQVCVRQATDLANVVAGFLQLTVRHPPPANQGFEVVLPGRS